MMWNIINRDTPMDEVLFKAPLLRDGKIFCVTHGKKLIGVISYGDLLRFAEKINSTDAKTVFAYELADKPCTKFCIETMEADVKELLNSGKTHIVYIPVVDSEDNLLTVLNANALDAAKEWSNAQSYELRWWINYLKEHIIITDSILHFKNTASSIWPTISIAVEKGVRDYIVGKTVLEIGCGPSLGFLPYFEAAQERIAIEPLLDEYCTNFLEGRDLSNIISKKYSIGADVFIPELVDSIDGLIISRNSLDHTPSWPFVLSNLSQYGAKGSYLYLWTDIQHHEKPIAGHYSITPVVSDFYRIIESIGYKIIESRHNAPLERENIFVELVAVKK